MDQYIETKPKKKPSSVANAIRLVKAFSDDDFDIGICDLSRRMRMPKSSVHRLATTLVDAGMLEQNAESGKYRLGILVFELGSLVRRKMDFSSEAKPHLMALRDKTDETVNLAILDSTSIVYINSLASKQAVRVTPEVGSRASAYETAAGKVLLAFQTDSHMAADVDALGQELATVRKLGYAIADDPHGAGARSLAAPIRDHLGKVVAAASIVGPALRLTKRNLASFASEVMGSADAISFRLGYQPLRAIAPRSAADGIC